MDNNLAIHTQKKKFRSQSLDDFNYFLHLLLIYKSFDYLSFSGTTVPSTFFVYIKCLKLKYTKNL